MNFTRVLTLFISHLYFTQSDTSMIIRIKPLMMGSAKGKWLPRKAYPGDAGFDLFAAEGLKLWAGATMKVPVGFAMQLPRGTYAHIHARSSLAINGITVPAGVIDEGYRGELFVMLHNDWLCPNSYVNIEKGSKIAQMIIHPFHSAYQIDIVDELEPSVRDCNGFGSSDNFN